MATISIGQSTAVYPSGNQESVTLKNVGAEIVYVSNVPIAAGSGSGMPLGVGSSMIWDARKPLYAAAPSTGNGQLFVLENSGNLFDAQAVAAEILAGGLAQDIASAIEISGAPPINIVTPIFSDSLNIDPGTVWGRTFNDLKYQRLVINVGANGGTGDVDEYDELSIYFPDINCSYDYWIPTGQDPAQIVIPVRGSTMYVSYKNNTTGMSYSDLHIFGTYSTDDPSVQYNALNDPPVGSWSRSSWSSNTVVLVAKGQNTTARRIKIPSRNGHVRFAILGLNSSNNTFQFGLNDPGGTATYFYSNTAVPASGVSAELIIGDQPLQLRYQLTTGSTGFSLVMQYL